MTSKNEWEFISYKARESKGIKQKNSGRRGISHRDKISFLQLPWSISEEHVLKALCCVTAVSSIFSKDSLVSFWFSKLFDFIVLSLEQIARLNRPHGNH